MSVCLCEQQRLQLRNQIVVKSWCADPIAGCGGLHRTPRLASPRLLFALVQLLVNTLALVYVCLQVSHKVLEFRHSLNQKNPGTYCIRVSPET